METHGDMTGSDVQLLQSNAGSRGRLAVHDLNHAESLRLTRAQVNAIVKESGSGLVDGIAYRFNQQGLFMGNSSSYVKCSNKYTESSESVSDTSMSCLL